MLAPWKKSYDQPRQHIKKQRHYFTNKGLSSQSLVGCRLWGRTESDTTEVTYQQQQQHGSNVNVH